MSKRPFDNTQKGSREERGERREQLRRKLFDQQNGLCWLCGKPMVLTRKGSGMPGRTFASFDHVVPKANGGTTYHTNLKLAHRMCNSARNERPAETQTPSLEGK